MAFVESIKKNWTGVLLIALIFLVVFYVLISVFVPSWINQYDSESKIKCTLDNKEVTEVPTKYHYLTPIILAGIGMLVGVGFIGFGPESLIARIPRIGGVKAE
jgi:NADH:ubiquinone oxidoreductase subunit 6 (subunit J)